MWKLIFNEATNIGTGCNREPGVGEFSRDLAPAQCAWFNVYPGRYMWNGFTIIERPEWAQEEADREAAQTAAITALQTRIAGIETAQSDAGLKQYTVQQGTDWITAKLTNAPATIVGVKQAVGEILIKMLPYILPK